MEKEQIKEAYEYIYKKADNYTEGTIKGTIGHVSEETVKKYIENQKNV